MGLLSLISRLLLDTSDYERGVNRAQTLGNRFANNVEKDIGKKLNKAFGLGGVIAGAVALKRATFDSSAELEQLAASHDLTVEQLLQIQFLAAQAGKSFDEYRRDIESTGRSLRDFARLSPVSSGAMFGAASARQINSVGAKTGGIVDFFTGWLPREILSNMMDFWRDMFGGNSMGNMARTLGRPLPVKPNLQASGPGMFAPGLAFLNMIPAMGEVRNGFEINRRIENPHLNALQQVGAFTSQEQTTVELRTAVLVLKHVDGTLEKINSKINQPEVRLSE